MDSKSAKRGVLRVDTHSPAQLYHEVTMGHFMSKNQSYNHCNTYKEQKEDNLTSAQRRGHTPAVSA